MKIINLDYLENTPLSTQLSKLSGDGWHAGAWTNQDGGKPSTIPGEVIKNVKTGQLFKMPKRQSKIIDYFGLEWALKMQLLESGGIIQIDEDTHEHLLCAVPPARGGWSAYLAGEAMTHDKSGKAVYSCCFEHENKNFLTYSNIPDFDKKSYLKTLEKHLEYHDLF